MTECELCAWQAAGGLAQAVLCGPRGEHVYVPAQFPGALLR